VFLNKSTKEEEVLLIPASRTNQLKECPSVCDNTFQLQAFFIVETKSGLLQERTLKESFAKGADRRRLASGTTSLALGLAVGGMNLRS